MRVAGEHAERDREPTLGRQRADAARRLADHQIEVRRPAPDHGAQADDAVEAARLGHAAGQPRQLHRARAAKDLDVAVSGARLAQRLPRAREQPVDDGVVEARRHQREPPAVRPERPFVGDAGRGRPVGRSLGCRLAHVELSDLLPPSVSRSAITLRGGADRHALDDLEAVAAEADDAARVVGEQADRPRPEVRQHLRAQAKVGAAARGPCLAPPAGRAARTKGFEVGDQARAAAREDVEQHARARLLDHAQRHRRRVIVLERRGAEHVAQHAGRLHAHEHRLVGRDLAQHERQVLGVLDVGGVDAGRGTRW